MRQPHELTPNRDFGHFSQKEPQRILLGTQESSVGGHFLVIVQNRTWASSPAASVSAWLWYTHLS